jgi:hypothetical protein
MFWAYILAIFRELQVRCWTGESTLPTIQVLKSLAALLSVLNISFFVELRVSHNNVKILSLTKSWVTVGAVFKRAAVTQYSGFMSVFSRYHKI